MKYLELASYTDSIKVAKIIIGSSSRISKIPEAELFEIMDAYLDAGGNCIDSARGYFGGKSELLIGKWQHSRKLGDKVLLCTKAGNALDPRDPNARPRLSYAELKDDLSQSLRALQSDHIDIFWLHRDDPSIPVAEIVETLNALIKEGNIRFAGCSNWTHERIDAANRYAAEHGLCGFLASQIRWSLGTMRPEADREHLPYMTPEAYAWYLAQEFPVFAFSSQAQGFFAKAAAGGVESLSPAARAAYETPENLERLARVQAFATEKGVSVSAAVLGYIINNRVPAVAVITSSNKEQLQDSLGAVDLSMTSHEADALFG